MTSSINNYINEDHLSSSSSSLAARFFHAYPRLTSRQPFSPQAASAYTRTIFILAVPYFVVATILIIILSIFILTVYLRNRKNRTSQSVYDIISSLEESRPSEALQTSSSNNSTSTTKPVRNSTTNRESTVQDVIINQDENEYSLTDIAFLPFCALLCAALTITIALTAFSALCDVTFAIADASIILSSAISSVTTELLFPASIMLRYMNLANEVVVAHSSDPETLTAFAPDLNLLIERTLTFRGLYSHAHDVKTDLGILQSLFIFQLSPPPLAVIAGISVILVLAMLGVTLISDMYQAYDYSRRQRQRLMVMIFFIFPILATWSLAAISTSIAAASGDFCDSLFHFQTVMETPTSKYYIPDNRSFLKDDFFTLSSLHCGQHNNTLEEAQNFLNSTKDLPTFPSTLDFLTNSTVHSSQWPDAVTHMQSKIGEYVTCATSKRMVSNLLDSVCVTSQKGESLTSALGCVWVSACGSSLLVCVFIVMYLVRQPTTEHVCSTALMNMYGGFSATETDFEQDMKGEDDDHDDAGKVEMKENKEYIDRSTELIDVRGEGLRAWCADTDISSSVPSSGAPSSGVLRELSPSLRTFAW